MEGPGGPARAPRAAEGGRRQIDGCELGRHLLVAAGVQPGAHGRARVALRVALSRSAPSFIPRPAQPLSAGVAPRRVGSDRWASFPSAQRDSTGSTDLGPPSARPAVAQLPHLEAVEGAERASVQSEDVSNWFFLV